MFRRQCRKEKLFTTKGLAGAEVLNGNTINEENITQTDALELPIRSRILFSSNGIEKLTSIDNTLNRYGKFLSRTYSYCRRCFVDVANFVFGISSCFISFT